MISSSSSSQRRGEEVTILEGELKESNIGFDKDDNDDVGQERRNSHPGDKGVEEGGGEGNEGTVSARVGIVEPSVLRASEPARSPLPAGVDITARRRIFANDPYGRMSLFDRPNKSASGDSNLRRRSPSNTNSSSFPPPSETSPLLVKNTEHSTTRDTTREEYGLRSTFIGTRTTVLRGDNDLQLWCNFSSDTSGDLSAQTSGDLSSPGGIGYLGRYDSEIKSSSQDLACSPNSQHLGPLLPQYTDNLNTTNFVARATGIGRVSNTTGTCTTENCTITGAIDSSRNTSSSRFTPAMAQHQGQQEEHDDRGRPPNVALTAGVMEGSSSVGDSAVAVGGDARNFVGRSTTDLPIPTASNNYGSTTNESNNNNNLRHNNATVMNRSRGEGITDNEASGHPPQHVIAAADGHEDEGAKLPPTSEISVPVQTSSRSRHGSVSSLRGVTTTTVNLPQHLSSGVVPDQHGGTHSGQHPSYVAHIHNPHRVIGGNMLSTPQRTDSHKSIPSLHPGKTYDSAVMNSQSQSYDQYTIHSGGIRGSTSHSLSHVTRQSSSSQSFAQTRRLSGPGGNGSGAPPSPRNNRRSMPPYGNGPHGGPGGAGHGHHTTRPRGSPSMQHLQQTYVPPGQVPGVTAQRTVSYSSSTRGGGGSQGTSHGSNASTSRAAAAASANYHYQQQLSERQLYYNNRATRLLHRGMYNEYHNPEDRYPASSSPILEVPEEIYAVRRAALTVLRPLTRAWLVFTVGFSLTLVLGMARWMYILNNVPYWLIFLPSWLSHFGMLLCQVESGRALSVFISDANENRQRPDTTDHLDRTEYLPMLQRSLKFGLKAGCISFCGFCFEVLLYIKIAWGSLSLGCVLIPVWLIVTYGIIDGIICKTQHWLRVMCWTLLWTSMLMAVLRVDYGYGNMKWNMIHIPIIMTLCICGSTLAYIIYGHQIGYFRLTESQLTAGILYSMSVMIAIVLLVVMGEILPLKGHPVELETRLFLVTLAPLTMSLVGVGAWAVSKDEFRRLLQYGGQAAVHPMKLKFDSVKGWDAVEGKGVTIVPMFGEVRYEPLDSSKAEKVQTEFCWGACCAGRCYPYDEDDDAPNLEYGRSSEHYRYISATSTSISRSATTPRSFGGGGHHSASRHAYLNNGGNNVHPTPTLQGGSYHGARTPGGGAVAGGYHNHRVATTPSSSPGTSYDVHSHHSQHTSNTAQTAASPVPGGGTATKGTKSSANPRSPSSTQQSTPLA